MNNQALTIMAAVTALLSVALTASSAFGTVEDQYLMVSYPDDNLIIAVESADDDNSTAGLVNTTGHAIFSTMLIDKVIHNMNGLTVEKLAEYNGKLLPFRTEQAKAAQEEASALMALVAGRNIAPQNGTGY